MKNSGLAKEIKQEVNFVSEAEYQFEDSDQCQVVPPIILPIQLDDQITTEGLIDCGSTSDFISQKLVNGNPTVLRPRPTSSPALLHNALTNKSVRVNEELLTKIQFQSPVKAKVKSPTLLKVAPLVSHDVILGMPFLKQNDLLVDPVARTVIPRKQSLLVVERDHLCQGRQCPHAGSRKYCTDPVSSCNQDRSSTSQNHHTLLHNQTGLLRYYNGRYSL